MSIEQTHETWEVESNGEVFETNFVEMTNWIEQGSLLRIDRVRKGNLRWIEAGKVPSLVAVFNAKDNGQPLPPPVITLTKLGPSTIPGNSVANPANFDAQPFSGATEPLPSSEPACCVHPDIVAAFYCDTCANQFCKTCPNSYGGTVKICPFCGAMCSSLAKPEVILAETYYAPTGSFGFGDFTAALAYPFKFKASLIMGAIMFMFLSVGQSVVSFGGIFMMWGAIVSFMLANTLTFGIMANTVENFSQGKLDLNFMPSFDDFSLWEDVVHPFFLMISVYISSFGPLGAVLLLAFFFIVAPVKKEITGMQSEALRTINPQLPYAANAARQSDRVNEILKRNTDEQQRRVEMMESGEDFPDEVTANSSVKNADDFDDEQHIMELNNMIQESRKAQLESAIGPAPETVAAQRAEMLKQFIGYGVLILIAAGTFLLWALFYYPAACAVAAYTRSIGATLNPTVGLDTIRRLGVDYVKILLMGLILGLISLFIGGVLAIVLSPFDMPRVGNLPATAIGSIFAFYLSIVFSCVIGFALCKAAERLKLYR